MVWTGQSFSVGQVLTAAQMTNLQGDITAVANGDSGAPAIQTAAYGTGTVDQAALGANSVGQSEVKTTYQQVSLTQEFTATGGVYTIGHSIQGDDGIGSNWDDYNMLHRRHSTDTPSFLSRWYWQAVDPLDNDDARLYYINSSPPYDLGDGDIPLFAYALINNGTSEIEQMNIAPDPVWAYNGPTNVVPCRYDRKTGKTYRQVKDMSAHPLTFDQAKTAGVSAVKDYCVAFDAADWVEEEITQSIKNADQDLIPNPWIGNRPDFFAGKTVVLLDPVADSLWKLMEFMEHKEADLSEMVRNYFTIGNTTLPRKGPKGLMIVSANWR